MTKFGEGLEVQKQHDEIVRYKPTAEANKEQWASI
jgi:hypothetical protein